MPALHQKRADALTPDCWTFRGFIRKGSLRRGLDAVFRCVLFRCRTALAHFHPSVDLLSHNYVKQRIGVRQMTRIERDGPTVAFAPQGVFLHSPTKGTVMSLKSQRARTRQQLGAIALQAAIGIALSLPVASVLADAPAVSIGAGVRTSFDSIDYDNKAIEDVNDFELNSARIYISGKVTDNISVMFNTEYSGGDEKIQVMDAAAQFAFSDQVNIWAGRFLPPSDRANLYGPYYANNWGVYQDGVQDGFPAESVGRDDGLMYWGQFGIAKVSAGAFDITSTKGDADVLYAARAQLDFWDAEGGYYLNGTYYGEKDLLAVGAVIQAVGSGKAYGADFLLEKKLSNAGVITVEAEYMKYDGFGGYLGANIPSAPESDGYYGLVAYVFPQVVGIGKFQALGKYGEATHDYTVGSDVKQKTLELDLNYLIKSFNARVSLFYIDKSFDPNVGADNKQIGLGLQVQI
jgi:hypothetical protein